MKEQYHANKEKWLDYQRKYRANHRAEVNANQNKYRRLNLQKVRERAKRYYDNGKLKRALNGDGHLGGYRSEEHREKHKIHARKSYRKHLEKRNAEQRAWQKANPEKMKLYSQRSREKHKVKRYAGARSYKRKLRFAAMGITEADYDRMFFQQGGHCWICGAEPKTHQTSPDKLLRVDHDHFNGNVRGLLCPKCNSGLGFFNDDPALLVNAIAYVTQNAKEVAA